MAQTKDGTLEYTGFDSRIQAAATELDGFVVRDDFMPYIREYIRKNTVFWSLIQNKEPAEADLVREIREDADPVTGFFAKNDMNSLTETGTGYTPFDLTDSGQSVKAGGGLIEISHYSRSLHSQQGRPYGDQLSRKTAKLISSSAKSLERALFKGNSAVNPLEFNGLDVQIPNGNVIEADKTTDPPDSISKKLRSIVRYAINDDERLRNITHIFTSGLGVEYIEDELYDKLTYRNLSEIRPNFNVPAINSQNGQIPVIPSPYLNDIQGATESDPDYVEYYLINMDHVFWRGVYPYGGARTFDPQIFEVSSYTDSDMTYLVEKRLCLFYGTLFLGNQGFSFFKLKVKVPPGTIGSI